MVLMDPIIQKEDTEVSLFTGNTIIKLWIATWKGLRNIKESSKRAIGENKYTQKSIVI